MTPRLCTPEYETRRIERLQQLRILLIEDSESDAGLVAARLHQTDTVYRIDWVSYLALGKQKLAECRYDAVLLDLNLPDSEGLATFELLHEAFPNVPVIVLSGLDDQELAEESVRRGAEDYVPKVKADGATLNRAIRYARERTRRRAAEQHLQHVHEEIAAARKIQQFLFPKVIPDLQGWDIAGDCRATTAVGGDFFDIFPIGEGKLGLVVADVSSHGFGPALIMTEARRLVRTLARSHADPAEVLTVANRALIEDTPDDMFVTLFLAVLDTQTRALFYASAGHEGYVLRPTGEVTVLESTGIPLGVCEGAAFSWMKLGALAPDDVLVLLTDGFREADASNGDLFGIERTLAVVQQLRKQPAREIVDILFDTVFAFCRPNVPHDDLTSLIVKADGVGGSLC